MRERRTLRILLLLWAGGCGLAAAFLGPVSLAGSSSGGVCRHRPKWGPHRSSALRARGRGVGGVRMMSEAMAVESVGSGRFQPEWPIAPIIAAAAPGASMPLQQQAATTTATTAPASRFRRPSTTAAVASTSTSHKRSQTQRGGRGGRPAPAVPKQLRIVLTGFGPFRGVADNPSEALARRLGAAATTTDQEPLGAGPDFALSSSVVETSAGGAAEGLAAIHQQLEREGLGKDANLLFVHLGVRNDIEGFHLESVGYNEADFQVPDQRDFQPRGQAVSPTDADTSHLLFSTLPLQSITRALHSQRGYTRSEVAISTDPGRFCCNYLYFRSLEFCRNRGPNTAALFVHLPPFSRVPSDDQFAFLHHLLSTAAAHFPHVGQTPGLLA